MFHIFFDNMTTLMVEMEIYLSNFPSSYDAIPGNLSIFKVLYLEKQGFCIYQRFEKEGVRTPDKEKEESDRQGQHQAHRKADQDIELKYNEVRPRVGEDQGSYVPHTVQTKDSCGKGFVKSVDKSSNNERA